MFFYSWILSHFNRSIILFLSTIFIATQAYSNTQPSWITKLPSGKEKKFYYFKGYGESNLNITKAQNMAVLDILNQISMQNTLSISTTSKSVERVKESMGDKYKYSSDYSLHREILLNGESAKIPGLYKEEDYSLSSKNTHKYWILMKIPKSENISPDYSIKQGYGTMPVFKSLLVPGWGQFHKGEPGKGWKFLITEITLTSSFFISNYFSQNYNQKAMIERDLDNREYYNTWSDRSYTIGTLSGVFAGAIYVYNIFDAVISPGAKKYAYSKKNTIKLTAQNNYIAISIPLP